MMNGGPLSWKNQQQDNVSLSTFEAKFVAASLAGQKTIYLREMLTDFGFSQTHTKATLLYEDNLACVAMSKNPVRQRFSCHLTFVITMCVNSYWLAFSNLCLYAPRHKMVANVPTKNFLSLAFVGLRNHQIMTGNTSFSARLLRYVGGDLSADFERCVFPYYFSIDCLYVFSPSVLQYQGGFELHLMTFPPLL